jgi:hypothetical protein
MKNILNKSVLAVIYYNLKKPNTYQMDNKEDRQRAERAFTKASKDKETLDIAIKDYKDLLEKELLNL